MPTATYIPLATTTLTGAATEIIFDSLPSTFRDLVIVMNGTTSVTGGIGIRFNSDSGNNYSYTMMDGYGSGGGSSFTSASDNSINTGVMSTGQSKVIWQVMDYSTSNKNKSVLIRTNEPGAWGVRAAVGRWANTNPITNVRIVRIGSHTISAGTTIAVYGIAS